MNTKAKTTRRIHTSIYVKDLDAAVNFYKLLFDTEPLKTEKDYAKFLPEDPAVVFTMIKRDHGNASNLFGHMGIEVPDEETLELYKSRFTKAGYPITEEMETACCYAMQSKFWASDPDGYRWEVYQFKGDVHSATVSGDSKIAANQACC